MHIVLLKGNIHFFITSYNYYPPWIHSATTKNTFDS